MYPIDRRQRLSNQTSLNSYVFRLIVNKLLYLIFYHRKQRVKLFQTGEHWCCVRGQRAVVIGGQRFSARDIQMLSPGRTLSSRLLRPISRLHLRLGSDGRAASSLPKGNSHAEQIGRLVSIKLIPT